MKGWILGGGAAVVAVGAGAATWAAVSFFGAGPQPSDVMPADTIAYVSVDLDPSGSQKIAALRLANKFPALKKEIGLSTSDDIRRKLVESFAKDSGCTIDYSKDVQPWLGSTIGFGLVGASDPQPVFALEIKDEDKAKTGAEKLLSCGDGDDELGFEADGDFLVFAKDKTQAHNTITAAKKGSLSDSDDFKKWTSAAGDSGILTAYAAPKAGDALATEFGSLTSDLSGLSGDGLGELGGLSSDDSQGSGPSWCPGAGGTGATTSMLKKFGGGGATLRFSDHGLELEFAGDFGASTSGAKKASVTDLPADVGAAFGMGFADGWLDKTLTSLKETCGDQFDPQSLYEAINSFTGLDAPADLETLTSDSVQLVVGPKIDVEALINSADPSALPVALRVKGDPDKIKTVVGKLAKLAPGSPVFDPKAGAGSVTIGFDPDLRDQVAAGGKLGDDASFKSVVPNADKANSVLFISLARLSSAIVKAAGGDNEVAANVEPLKAFGVSGWLEGKVSHGELILSTD
ncbi:DUF3352 domain-containing protein [Nocardioides sp. Kera G14]|uniref:DUF3352 domain-containing protein n=1 Tax=Nocardioides sp. Kera G14 TaxID=2884264 RepID=UPI001D116719|nr:DUF3352 domain-containing protein [Nocardioides sp. Kera G14]UDY22472.1 DUF3352 domain-containing protein [Nocardioides sp. Kera G14]